MSGSRRALSRPSDRATLVARGFGLDTFKANAYRIFNFDCSKYTF